MTGISYDSLFIPQRTWHISKRQKNPFQFHIVSFDRQIHDEQFAGGISWGVEKEGEAWKSQKGADFCSNLTHIKKMTIIKKATNDNIYPTHSNRSQAASNCTGQ